MLGEVLHDRVHQLEQAAEAAGQYRLLAQVSEELGSAHRQAPSLEIAKSKFASG